MTKGAVFVHLAQKQSQAGQKVTPAVFKALADCLFAVPYDALYQSVGIGCQEKRQATVSHWLERD